MSNSRGDRKRNWGQDLEGFRFPVRILNSIMSDRRSCWRIFEQKSDIMRHRISKVTVDAG